MSSLGKLKSSHKECIIDLSKITDDEGAFIRLKMPNPSQYYEYTLITSRKYSSLRKVYGDKEHSDEEMKKLLDKNPEVINSLTESARDISEWLIKYLPSLIVAHSYIGETNETIASEIISDFDLLNYVQGEYIAFFSK